jgi:hypothetical protein
MRRSTFSRSRENGWNYEGCRLTDAAAASTSGGPARRLSPASASANIARSRVNWGRPCFLSCPDNAHQRSCRPAAAPGRHRLPPESRWAFSVSAVPPRPFACGAMLPVFGFAFAESGRQAARPLWRGWWFSVEACITHGHSREWHATGLMRKMSFNARNQRCCGILI